MSEYVYTMVTDDKYEFPIAMADTATELGKIIGKSDHTIRSSICLYKKGKLKRTRYHKIKIDYWEDANKES